MLKWLYTCRWEQEEENIILLRELSKSNSARCVCVCAYKTPMPRYWISAWGFLVLEGDCGGFFCVEFKCFKITVQGWSIELHKRAHVFALKYIMCK